MFAHFYLSSLVAVGYYLANASPLISRQAQMCTRNYTVAASDTCDSISAAQDVSSFQLAHDNPSIDATCDNLQAGQSLCLGVEGQDCTQVHTVSADDTCSAIAMSENIPLATLLTNNPNVNANCSNIHPGEVLCTASEVINYTS